MSISYVGTAWSFSTKQDFLIISCCMKTIEVIVSSPGSTESGVIVEMAI